MYSWHIWIILRETTTDADNGNLRGKLARLDALIEQTKLIGFPSKPIATINNEHIFQHSGSHNHRGTVSDRIDGILNWIAEELPGSFGITYWLDDDSHADISLRCYNVIVLARGVLTRRSDPFLSPIVPVIED